MSQEYSLFINKKRQFNQFDNNIVNLTANKFGIDLYTISNMCNEID